MATLGDVVREFRDAVELRIDRVHKKSFADVMGRANQAITEGGLMPIVTGDLQDSITVGSDNGVATGKRHYQSAINGASPNSPMAGSWDIFYAPFVEFGTRFQRAQPFARTATLAWDIYFRRNLAVL